jgi:hypothetical protein
MASDVLMMDETAIDFKRFSRLPLNGISPHLKCG